MKAIGENKRCGHCHEWKHVRKFNRDVRKLDGLCGHCKLCARVKRRTWHENNPGKQTEYANRYRQKHADRVQERDRLYRSRNHQEIKEKNLLRYHANKERYAENNRKSSVRKHEKYLWMKEKLAELGINV